MTSVKDNTAGLKKQNDALFAKIDEHKNKNEEMTLVETKMKK